MEPIKMTQEEKLEKAKELYKTANADQRYVLERLFPELIKRSLSDFERKISDILFVETSADELSIERLLDIAIAISDGLTKDAINGLVYAQRTNGEVIFRSNYVKKEGFELGDKVKMIIIKED